MLSDMELSSPQQAVTRMERDKTSINSPLFRFLDRETIIAENLLYTVMNDLSDIQGVCAETVKPTNRLRAVMKSLSKGTIPKSEWAKYVLFARVHVCAVVHT